MILFMISIPNNKLSMMRVHFLWLNQSSRGIMVLYLLMDKPVAVRLIPCWVCQQIKNMLELSQDASNKSLVLLMRKMEE